MTPCLLLLPALASAEPERAPDRYLFGQPVYDTPERTAEEISSHRAAFEQWVEDNDLVAEGDLVLPRSSFEPDPNHPRGGMWEEPPHYGTIFLNFFGGEMTNGSNAAEMESQCVMGTVQYPAYIGTEQLALAMIQVFESDMSPYAVRIAYEEVPPAHLPYQMVMMGGEPEDIGMSGNILGVSCAPDCGDMWWRDTTFAFTEVSGQTSVLGHTALQEAAHAFGLAHINGSNHIMYPTAGAGDKVWATQCESYNDSTGGINCQSFHDYWCPGDSQNSDAELMAYFGPDAPDTEAPVVTILQPADGDVIEAGGTVEVQTEVTDNVEGVGWRLRVTPPSGDDLIANAYTFETAWALANLESGTYEIYVDAIDHDRNETTEHVTLHVGEGPSTDTGETSDSDSDSDGETGATDDGPTDDTGGTETAGGSGEGGTDDSKGCNCRSGAAGWPALGLLLVPVFVRRRG